MMRLHETQLDWVSPTPTPPQTPRPLSRMAASGVLSDTPRARASDPETSHEAAAAIKASGELGRQQRAVLDLVRRFPGRTSIELAALSDRQFDRYQVARRLPELAPVYVRRSDSVVEINGRRHHTWFPV